MNSSQVSIAITGGDLRPSVQFGPVLDEVELARAARSDAPILFTGQQHDVRTLALRIHDMSGWCWGPFLAVDCREPGGALEERLFRVLESERSHGTAVPVARLLQPGTLFLHEVGALDTQSQSRLRDLLGEAGTPNQRRGRRRIMAFASELLVTRVSDGTFDDLLFYRLNRLHFVL